MLKRLATLVAGALAASATMLVTAPPAAAAATCVALPVSTIGFTVGAADEEVRVPAITDVNVCLWSDGSYGSFAPRIEQPTGCGDPCLRVVLVNWRMEWNYGVTFRADGVYNEYRTLIPGVETGPPGEACLFSIGSPADTSCLTYLNVG